MEALNRAEIDTRRRAAVNKIRNARQEAARSDPDGEVVGADPRVANILHLMDLKRAGHTTEHYLAHCEYGKEYYERTRELAPHDEGSGCA